MSNLGMSRYLSLTKWCYAASFTRTSHYSTLNFIYEKTYNFSITQLKAGWIYLDIAAFQNFKVFLLLPHACEDFGEVSRDLKVKKKLLQV